MPIHVGADNIDPVSIGKVTISEAYVGADKVYGYDPLQILTLTSAEDFDLKTFLDASGVDYAKPIIINMASDQVIGGVNATAFTIAGLPTHSTITININGQIQGKTSGNAVDSDEAIDVISGGQISGGISVGLDVDTALITFVVSSTGKILGGGGNGGQGGAGGQGDTTTNNEGPFFQDNVYVWWYGTTPATVQPSKWAGNTVFTNDTTSGGSTIYARRIGSYWYQPGVLADGGAKYYIRRGIAITGNTPAGGSGGLGAGYNQARTNGVNGTTGTYRSGNGGQGGNGGDWGVAGATGQKGGTGLYITDTNASATRAGANGTAGSAAGFSFYLTTSNLVFYGVDSPQARALNL